jgi:hypothetical protein
LKKKVRIKREREKIRENERKGDRVRGNELAHAGSKGDLMSRELTWGEKKLMVLQKGQRIKRTKSKSVLHFVHNTPIHSKVTCLGDGQSNYSSSLFWWQKTDMGRGI